jgi:hypothetical protein
VNAEPPRSAEPEVAPASLRPPRIRAWLTMLLAERSRRGRIASWTLAIVAAIVAAIVVWSFFPHDRSASVDVTLGGDAAAVGPLRELVVWPGMQIQMAGTRASDSTAIQLVLDRTQIGVATSSPTGAFLIRALIPRGTSRGPHRLRALDTGTGRQIGRSDLEVRFGPRAELWTLPTKTTVGGRLAIAGGGFTPHSNLRVVWDPGSATERTLVSRRIKSLGVFTAAVSVPVGATTGVHRLVVLSAAGQTLAGPASVAVAAAR